MSKTLKALVKQRVRKIHDKNVAISAAGDPTIEPGLRFVKGFRAPLKPSSDAGRRMRRALERRMLKQLSKAGLGVSK